MYFSLCPPSWPPHTAFTYQSLSFRSDSARRCWAMSGDVCGCHDWGAPGMEWVETRDVAQRFCGPEFIMWKDWVQSPLSPDARTQSQGTDAVSQVTSASGTDILSPQPFSMWVPMWAVSQDHSRAGGHRLSLLGSIDSPGGLNWVILPTGVMSMHPYGCHNWGSSWHGVDGGWGDDQCPAVSRTPYSREQSKCPLSEVQKTLLRINKKCDR
jgi:hypothetical protein